jgi:hypothetical protein
MVYADVVNVLGENTNTIKCTVDLLKGSWEVYLEVNTEANKYMVVSRHRNGGQYDSLLIVNKSFENVAKFKYFGRNVTNPKFLSQRN